MLLKNFKQATDSVISNTKKYGVNLGILNLFQGSTSWRLTGIGVTVYATIQLLYFKTIKISDYMILVNAIGYVSWCFDKGAKLLSKVHDTSLYIQNVRDFLEYEPKIAQSQQGKIPEKDNLNISFKNVSYTYFGQTEPVLKNINMSIKKGEKIALVGHNGAGKSTLIKLLMRSVNEEDRTNIEQALRDSGVYDKVMTLPKGMNTM